MNKKIQTINLAILLLISLMMLSVISVTTYGDMNISYEPSDASLFSPSLYHYQSSVLMDAPREMLTFGDYLHVTSLNSHRIVVFNLTDESNIEYVNEVASGAIYDIMEKFEVNGTSYMALGGWGSTRSQIAHPLDDYVYTETGYYTFTDGLYAYPRASSEEHLYVTMNNGSGTDYIAILNVSDPYWPTLTSTYFNGSLEIYILDIAGDVMYVIDNSTLYAINISNPSSLSVISSMTNSSLFNGTPLNYGEENNGILYIMSRTFGSGGILRIDVSNPSDMVYLNGVETESGLRALDYSPTLDVIFTTSDATSTVRAYNGSTLASLGSYTSDYTVGSRYLLYDDIKDLIYITGKTSDSLDIVRWTPPLTLSEPNNYVFNTTVVSGENVTYSWTVNDSEVSTSENYTFSGNYTSAGSYSITVNVSDDNSSEVMEWLLIVTNTNSPPTIDSYEPTTLFSESSEPNDFIFNISESDLDGDAISFSWTSNGTEVGTSENYTFSGNYTSAGSYNITITISDGVLTDSQGWIFTVTSTNVNLTVDYYNITPTIPLITDNLTVSTTLSDDDIGDTLTVYLQMYNGSTLFGNVQSSELENGTLTNFYNLSSEYTNYEEVWTAEIWGSDGTFNTTHYNVSSTIETLGVINVTVNDTRAYENESVLFTWNYTDDNPDVCNFTLTYNISTVVYSNDSYNGTYNLTSSQDGNYVGLLMCYNDGGMNYNGTASLVVVSRIIQEGTVFRTGMCPTGDTPIVLMFGFLMLFAFGCIILSRWMQIPAVAFFGGLMLFVLSWYMIGCSGFIGFLMASIGVVVIAWSFLSMR